MSDRTHIRLVVGDERRAVAPLQPRDALLEREHELETIAAALDSVADRGSVVYVDGAAGLGKSRLVRAARDRALREGFLVLDASGHELERGFPFGLARQLLTPQLESLGPERARLLAGTAIAAGELLAGNRVRTREDPTGIGPVHGLCVLTERLVRHRLHSGALVAVDDAQWSDAASLRFLVSLAERVAELPIVMLVAARPTTDRSPLLARLAGVGTARVLRLSALGPEGIAAMVRLW